MEEKWATEIGTENFFKRSPIQPDKIRKFGSLNVSALGIGNYVGNGDEITDKFYEKAFDCAPHNLALAYQLPKNEKRKKSGESNPTCLI